MKRLMGIILILGLFFSTLPGQAPKVDAQGGVIPSGQWVTGDISRSGQQDNWTFRGNQGDRVTIELGALSGSGLDSYLELIAPSGRRENWADGGGSGLGDALINNWELQESGTYTIVAMGDGSSTGAYALLLWLGTVGQPRQPEPTPTPTPVTRTPVPVTPITGEGGPIGPPPLPPTPGGTVQLYRGWNNIAWLGQTAAAGQALSSIQGKYRVVYYWQAQNQTWQSYDSTAPTFANTLQNLTNGQAYWIYANQEVALTY